MAVYPFYTEVVSSTRKKATGVGCRAKAGQMTTYIKQRSEKAITTPYKIHQSTFEEDGVLYLSTQVLYRAEDHMRYAVISEHITKY